MNERGRLCSIAWWRRRRSLGLVTMRSARRADVKQQLRRRRCADWGMGVARAGGGGLDEWGWRLQAPVGGMALRLRMTGEIACFGGGVWGLRGSSVCINGIEVLGAQQAAIASPSGGTTIDNEARAAIAAMLSALRSHGLIEA